MNWYEATEEQIQSSPDLNETRYVAYYNTFMATEEGQTVLYDMMATAWQFEEIPKTSDNAIIFIALHEFIQKIKTKCGVVDQMEVIRAEAKIAAGHEIEQESEKKVGMYDD